MATTSRPGPCHPATAYDICCQLLQVGGRWHYVDGDVR